MEKNMFSINENQYKEMTDEKLIENIKQDDNMALNCLLERYNDVVNMKANKFFMVGAEREDMVQEGMIGLYKAVKSFDTEKQNSFKTFAGLCIERQMITAVKNSKVTKGETVLTITLKVKSTLSVKSTTVTLKDIVVSGGRVQDGGTGDINVNNASVTINADSDAISKNENTISNTTTTTNTTTNTTKQNTTLKDNTVTKKTTLPKTGIEQGGVIAIVVIAIVGTFSYVLYKKTSKEVK